MRTVFPATSVAQFTTAKSNDLRIAILRKALLAFAAGVGIWISVMISSLASTVLPGTLTSQKSCAATVRLDVTILASSATSAGAVSLGLTATHPFTAPKIE